MAYILGPKINARTPSYRGLRNHRYWIWSKEYISNPEALKPKPIPQINHKYLEPIQKWLIS